MIAVIQCAATKQPDAGRLCTREGAPVYFVADPEVARKSLREPQAVIYARPDDPSDDGGTWRDVLVKYNRQGDNPLELLPAWQLYRNAAYGGLVARYGIDNVYILSAGWGLIRSDFLTPDYDITFSQSVRKKAPYKIRRKEDIYRDFRMLPEATHDHIVFFGGKDYLALFCALTATIAAKKTVLYNSRTRPDMPGCNLRRFETPTLTNWHYECVRAFLDGTITID
jgi:hypothetical protein